MIFCTLFDSYYLDKGLALYHSLEKVADEFTIYIFCFDDRSREILLDMELKHAVILHHSDLEKKYDILLKLKEERSKAEYCWTCTPVTIEYVLKHFHEPNCTYIDADLYFFADPKVLLQEIEEVEADTVITAHRFTDSMNDRRLCKRSGKYCVEFNYFNQSDNAMEALSWWKERCFEWCYHLYEQERMGDQKYLEKFPVLFKGVHELQHLGGGVAPWNLHQYMPATDCMEESTLPNGSIAVKEGQKGISENKGILLQEKKTGRIFPLIFYHFQNMRYLSEQKVNVCSGTHSKPLKDAIYKPYLKEIEDCRKLLAKYGVSFGVKKVYSSNKLIAFLQGSVLRFKIKSLSDIFDLNEFR